MISWSALLVLIPLASAFPLASELRGNTACGQYDTVTSGSYSLLTDQWGLSDEDSGSQCSTLKSVLGNTAAWSTQWNWVSGGSTHVKTFSNLQLNTGINQQLNAITSMPSIWDWSQDSSDSESVVADVTFDLFTSDTAGGSKVNEVMVWLAGFHTGPISYEYDSYGKAVAIACNLGIIGHKWNLYLGTNGYNTVYSFLPASGNINSFNGDIYHFFIYLIDNGYIDSSEYLVIAQAGTEASLGSATFTTSAYSLSINS